MTSEVSAQACEFHRDRDLEDYLKMVKDLLAMSVRDRKELDLIRRKRLLEFRWAGNDKPRYL